MTKEEILQKLKDIKPKYEQEGFTILGLFGSYARNNATQNSDIDILYTINNMADYLKKYSGWEAINHIVDIKESLKQDLQSKVDFVDIETLNKVGKKYILNDVVYV